MLGAIAPRPVILIQPTVDYHSTAADIRACVGEAATVYALHGSRSALRYVEVDDFNRFSRKIADEVLRQLPALSSP